MSMQKGFDYTGVVVISYCHDGKGNYVMLRRGAKTRDMHGSWDFGGGGLEFGETLEEGLRREVKEEFGTEPISFEELGADDVLSEKDGRIFHWVGIFYSVLIDRDEAYNAEPDMHDDFGWYRMDALPEPLNPKVRAQLERFKDRL